MDASAVLALVTGIIGFVGFGSVSVSCFIGKYKLIGLGTIWGTLALFYGFVLALVIYDLTSV